MMLVTEFKIQLFSDIKNLKQQKSDMFERINPQSFLGALQSINAKLNADVTPTSVNCLKTIYVFIFKLLSNEVTIKLCRLEICGTSRRL